MREPWRPGGFWNSIWLLFFLGCSERVTEVVPKGSSGGSMAIAQGLQPARALFWLDARVGLELRDDAAAVWTDQSPHGYDATQADPLLRPVESSLQVALPQVPEFRGMDELVLPQLEFSGDDGVILLLLLNRSDESVGKPLRLGGGDGRSPLGFELTGPSDFGLNLRGTIVKFQGLLHPQQSALLVFRHYAGVADMRVNGVSARQWDSGGAFTQVRTDNFIGRAFKGRIAFAALFASGAAGDQLEVTERELAEAWGCCAD